MGICSPSTKGRTNRNRIKEPPYRTLDVRCKLSLDATSACRRACAQGAGQARHLNMTFRVNSSLSTRHAILGPQLKGVSFHFALTLHGRVAQEDLLY